MLNLKKFNSPMPVGVRLPEIEVDRKIYYQLDLDPQCSNYDLLRALCLRGVKQRGIDKLDNKQEYYDIDFDPKKLHDALYDIEKNFEIFLKQIWELEI